MNIRLKTVRPLKAQKKTNNIVVASTSLASLFKGKPIKANDGSFIYGKLHLPEYQRSYRWGEKQMKRLLRDLSQFFEGGQNHGPDYDFYLGSIILHQKPGRGGSGQLNIIDGQQRLTSMALLAYQMRKSSRKPQPMPDLQFTAPESQRRIRTNLTWLEKEQLPSLDFERINISLVVTRSEDDAYRFFETQNSGGVPLDGTAIIKPYHLRAVAPFQQDEYARLWESMGDLEPLVDALMKARHWQTLNWRDIASWREPKKVRDEIVSELAEHTGNQPLDLAYRQTLFCQSNNGWSQNVVTNGYAMRQPLNAGVNTIHYLRYFHQLRQELIVKQREPGLDDFYRVYRELVVQANGSPFLQKLFDSAILLYVSQFGCRKVFEASLWLFRVIYSPRLSNERMVRESTAQRFAKESKVLDWIASSYTHEQLMQYLQNFNYRVDPSNLDKSGVKGFFVQRVKDFLIMRSLPEESSKLAAIYDQELQAAIKKRTMEQFTPKGGPAA